MATQSDSQAIISGVTMNPETDIKYAKVKVNNSGGKSVSILNAATNAALNIQTPLMLTWGVNENTDKKTGEVQSYTMALQFPSDEYKTTHVSKFFTAIQAFEAKVKRDAITNSKEWFGKAMSGEVITPSSIPCCRIPRILKRASPITPRTPPSESNSHSTTASGRALKSTTPITPHCFPLRTARLPRTSLSRVQTLRSSSRAVVCGSPVEVSE
jgi:hypothetical protein